MKAARSLLQGPWRGVQRMLGYVLPGREYRRNTQRWDSSWAREDFSAIWMTEAVPRQIVEAVESGWFRPGTTVLDIGCGSGEHAAWLAERGFHAVGVDLSRAAIERAKARHGGMGGRLEFSAVDICREAPAPARFQALIDRGCFHCIRNLERRTGYGLLRTLSRNYVANVAACCVPGARFLLLVATFDHPGAERKAADEDELAREVRTLFQADFEIVKSARIVMDMAPNVPPMPALSFWMARR